MLALLRGSPCTCGSNRASLDDTRDGERDGKHCVIQTNGGLFPLNVVKFPTNLDLFVEYYNCFVYSQDLFSG